MTIAAHAIFPPEFESLERHALEVIERWSPSLLRPRQSLLIFGIDDPVLLEMADLPRTPPTACPELGHAPGCARSHTKVRQCART